MATIERVKEVIDNGSKLTNRDLLAVIDVPAERKHLGLTIEPFEFVVEVEQFIESTLGRLNRIAKKLWSIPDLDLHYALNYRDSAFGRSNAGERPAKWRSNYELKLKGDGDCINLNSLWGKMRTGQFTEYSHISRDPQIGAFETADWKVYVEVLLCHEFAHILEGYVLDESDFPFYPPLKCHGHDANWQNIYRWLRIKTGNVRSKTTNRETIEKLVLRTLPTCAFCGKAFAPTRSDAKVCSAKCKVYLNRKRRREQ